MKGELYLRIKKEIKGNAEKEPKVDIESTLGEHIRNGFCFPNLHCSFERNCGFPLRNVQILPIEDQK